MIAKEENKPLGMRIESVLAQHFGQVGHRLPMSEYIKKSEMNREVERSVEACIDAAARLTSGKERGNLGIAIHDLTYCSHARIDAVNLCVEVVPEGAVDVWKGVQPNAVEAGCFNPPQRILDEVAGDQRILLVQIRHRVGEPAVRDGVPRLLGRVWIDEFRKVAFRDDMVLQRTVKPIGRRRIDYPGMLNAKMIRHQVDHQLDAARMKGVREMAVVRERAEVRIDGIKIR